MDETYASHGRQALFWSCFGGVEMLRDFGLAEDFRRASQPQATSHFPQIQ